MPETPTFSIASIERALDEMQLLQTHNEECTWIAGTGKAELYVRDRLGATLAKNYPDLIVAREWGVNKHDLAILDMRAEPIAVLEGKHLFDFDLSAPSIRERYRRSIHKDRLKMATSGTGQQLLSLLMTSISAETPAYLKRVVKYSPGSNKYFNRFGDEGTSIAVDKAGQFLEEFGSVLHTRKLSEGAFHGLAVSLWIWIVDAS